MTMVNVVLTSTNIVIQYVRLHIIKHSMVVDLLGVKLKVKSK